MRKSLAVLTVAILCLSAVAGIASEKTSNKSKAIAAVKEALAEKWTTFEVGPPSYLNVD